MKIGFNYLTPSSFVSQVAENGKNFITQLDKRIYVVAALCFAILITVISIVIQRRMEANSEKSKEKNDGVQKKGEVKSVEEKPVVDAKTKETSIQSTANDESRQDFAIEDKQEEMIPAEGFGPEFDEEVFVPDYDEEVLVPDYIEETQSDSAVPGASDHEASTPYTNEAPKEKIEEVVPRVLNAGIQEQTNILEKVQTQDELDQGLGPKAEVGARGLFLLKKAKVIENPNEQNLFSKIERNAAGFFPHLFAPVPEMKAPKEEITTVLEAPKEETIVEPDPVLKTIETRLANNLALAIKQQKSEAATPKGFVVGSSESEQNPQSILVYRRWSQVDAPINGHQDSVVVDEVGVASCEGSRSSMEDADLFIEISFLVNGEEQRGRLYGVFDGHGGAEASAFAKNNLPNILGDALAKHAAKGLTDEVIWKTLKESFITLDKDYTDECKKQWDITNPGGVLPNQDGTTATAALVLGKKVYVANVGDSRTILCHGDEVIQLSEDAKPAMERFQRKITEAGGFVVENRINGMLAVARAIGDNGAGLTGANGPCVSPNPKITAYPVVDGDYLVLACDGLYDVATTDEVGAAIRLMAQEQCTTEQMARRLVHSAIAKGSLDNVSVVVVKLQS